MSKNAPVKKPDEAITISSVAEVQPELIPPYKLRAQQDTNFMKFEDGKLIYSKSFKRGQEVLEKKVCFDILASNQLHQFIKINQGAA